MSDGIYYERTPDPNIFHQWTRSEIHKDKLESQIASLEDIIDKLPRPKTTPDQDTLDKWNSLLQTPPLDKLNLKKALLTKLNTLPVVMDR